MKKNIILILFLLLIFFPIKANAENIPPLLSMEDITVDFSADGYTPSVDCRDEEIRSLVSYFAIDTVTSAPVSIPIKSPGTYQVFATFSGNSNYEKEEISSIIKIEPIKAKILINYNVVAYSKQENPISYTVEPSWASDFLDINVDYYPIESLNSFPASKISSPVNLGKYYTVFNVLSKTEGIICENKYTIYEISPYRGKKLSYEEGSASVPASFKCVFQNLNSVYEKDTPISVNYTLSPAAISGQVLYRKIHSDGTFSSYTSDVPIEPGQYMCGYFLGSVCIGEGNIFIDKKEIDISVKDETTEYIHGGITPKGFCENEDVEIAFTAFAIDEHGNVSMEETSIPIKKCGKYSIIAYPKDTEHYKRTYAYGFMEITPSTPKITVTETEFKYDGASKSIQVSVSPNNIKYYVEYYDWEDRDDNIPLGSPPSRAGKYMVKITAFDEDGNYNTSTKTAVMYIVDAPQPSKLSTREIILISVVFVLVTGLGITYFLKKRSPRKKK